MPELLPYLLVPVAALLFLNLRMSRRLRYPHDLLRAEARRGTASLLLRSFRLYYDVLLDGALAVAVAFALAPPRSARPAAVVIDGSRSMAAGLPGERPLDRALRRLRTDPALQGAEPFLLGLDPSRGETRLFPVRTLLEGTDPAGAAGRLRQDFTFFAPDYGRLAELRERGYGAVTLLTDQPRVRPEGFQVVALGTAFSYAVYPASVRLDRTSRTWLVALVETGPHLSLAVSLWDPAAQRFLRLPPDRYALEEGLAGRVLRFPAPGLYLLSARGPYGGDDIDLPLRLGPLRASARAAGPFSERMLSVFPEVDDAAPTVVFVDQGAGLPARGTPRATTALLPGEGDRLLDPAAAGGALIAVGAAPGSDLALGPDALANEDLVLAYEALLSRREPPFRTHPGGASLMPVGTAFLEGGKLPLVPPPSQFFETRPGARLVLASPVVPRWPWVLLLAGLTALKAAAWARISGKSLWARD